MERSEVILTSTYLTPSRPRVGMYGLLQFSKPTCQLLVIYLEWVVDRWQIEHLVVSDI